MSVHTWQRLRQSLRLGVNVNVDFRPARPRHMGLHRRGQQHYIVIDLHHQGQIERRVGQTERRVGGSSTAAATFETTFECVATGFECATILGSGVATTSAATSASTSATATASTSTTAASVASAVAAASAASASAASAAAASADASTASSRLWPVDAMILVEHAPRDVVEQHLTHAEQHRAHQMLHLMRNAIRAH